MSDQTLLDALTRIRDNAYNWERDAIKNIADHAISAANATPAPVQSASPAETAQIGTLPPVIAAYRAVACYAEVLLGVCIEADDKEELGNVDGSHLDALSTALGELADIEREGLDALFPASPVAQQEKDRERWRMASCMGLLQHINVSAIDAAIEQEKKQ